MTLTEVYQNGKQTLKKAGVESPAFDAMCLFEHVFHLDRQALIVRGGEAAPQDKVMIFHQEIEQRAQNRPLQYILGKWEFMSLQLEMGEGVLIAREDTEVLVKTAAELLSRRTGSENPLQILDLCGGTGAVSLGLASLLPNAEITCVELYDDAFRYLNTNRKNYPGYSVTAVQADVLNPKSVDIFGDKRFDAIVSNPPYIKSEDLPTLQSEVQKEPKTALDGGEDGLLFYRAISDYWLPLLKENGIAAVEVGEDEAQAVAELFAAAGLKQITFQKDFNNIDRVVAGRNQK
jgi:release factor glutamine methyltransferase